MDYREAIEARLVHLKPILDAAGRKIEVMEIDAPRIRFKVAGFCSGCACSSSYKEGLQELVQSTCPELTVIEFED